MLVKYIKETLTLEYKKTVTLLDMVAIFLNF